MNINDRMTTQELVTFINEHERAQSLLARIPSGPDDRIFLAPDTWMRRMGYRLVLADPPPGWVRDEKPPDPYAAFFEWCDANGYKDRTGARFDEAIKAYAEAGGAR